MTPSGTTHDRSLQTSNPAGEIPTKYRREEGGESPEGADLVGVGEAPLRRKRLGEELAGEGAQPLGVGPVLLAARHVQERQMFRDQLFEQGVQIG